MHWQHKNRREKVKKVMLVAMEFEWVTGALHRNFRWKRRESCFLFLSSPPHWVRPQMTIQEHSENSIIKCCVCDMKTFLLFRVASQQNTQGGCEWEKVNKAAYCVPWVAKFGHTFHARRCEWLKLLNLIPFDSQIGLLTQTNLPELNLKLVRQYFTLLTCERSLTRWKESNKPFGNASPSSSASASPKVPCLANCFPNLSNGSSGRASGRVNETLTKMTLRAKGTFASNLYPLSAIAGWPFFRSNEKSPTAARHVLTSSHSHWQGDRGWKRRGKSEKPPWHSLFCH